MVRAAAARGHDRRRRLAKVSTLLRLVLAAGLILSVGAPARAQGTSRNVPGSFDFYVLALSWSAGFCANSGDQKGRRQCAAGSKLGFTVHGLWPQFDRGYPSDCGAAGQGPSQIALQRTRGVYPEEGLARYEWRRHGSCSGKSPERLLRRCEDGP